MHALRLTLTLLLLPAVVHAYELWLDIDTDDDPTTINEVTEAEEATIRLVLVPSVPDEEISFVAFGRGGYCEDCEGFAQYGANWTSFAWTDPRFDVDLIGFPFDMCFGPWSAHVNYYLTAIEPFALSAPTFVGSFVGVIAEPVYPGCSVPAHRLAAIPQLPDVDFWNFVEIGAVPVPAETATWGRVKAVYGSR